MTRCVTLVRFFLALCLLAFSFGSIPIVSADGPSFHGSLSNRYKFRATGSANDHDAETLLTLDIGNARTDRFSAALQIGGLFDLDGTSDADNVFSSLYDTINDRAVGRLYYAYFDAKKLGPIGRLRVGRQHRYEFESLYYDGLTLETVPFADLTLTVFGGVPVHLFENHFGFDPGDWVAGGALQWNPLSNFQTRIDYVFLRDKVTGFRGVGNQKDNLLGATIWWDIDPRVSLMGRFTTFTDQVRDMQISTTLRLPKKDFALRFNFYKLLETYNVRVIEADAFGIAGAYLPYTEVSLSATKGWRYFALDGGLALRFLEQNAGVSAFNHGYERVYLSGSIFDLPIKGFSLSLTGDYYHSEDSTLKDNFFGGSLTLAQRLFEDRLKLSGGTQFYLYRYNLFTGNESDDVQTYFVNVRGKILKNFEGRAGYTFEDNDRDNFHTVDVRFIWSF